jgi:UDP-N-acetylmuramyl pentapeptide phosphotransferase/UDP-N-acetylglucosamine-1-phosphate transferase
MGTPALRKMLRIVGRVIMTAFDAYITLAFAAAAWDAFRPAYGNSPHVGRAVMFGVIFLILLVVTVGMALDRTWARSSSWIIMLGVLAFCAVTFWDGYLRIKPKYTGEEGGEAGVAVLLSIPTLVALLSAWMSRSRSETQ